MQLKIGVGYDAAVGFANSHWLMNDTEPEYAAVAEAVLSVLSGAAPLNKYANASSDNVNSRRVKHE